MLRLEPFELLFPETVDEAISLSREHPGALFLAGGTDLVPKLKRRQFEPAVVISLDRVGELRTIVVEKGRVRIGARSTLRSLETHPELSALGAVRQSLQKIATPIIRQSGTVAGNLLQDTRCRYYDRGAFWREATGYCLKKDGDECRVAPGGGRCFATFCSDLAAALIVHDTRVTLRGATTREILLEDLYQNDGMAHLALDGEILVSIDVPLTPRRSVYKKLRLRDGFDFPEAGVATAVVSEGSSAGSPGGTSPGNSTKASFGTSPGASAGASGAEHILVAITGIEPYPVVVRSEGPLADLDRDAFAGQVYQTIKPVDTMFLPPAHRKRVVRNFVRQSLDELLPT